MRITKIGCARFPIGEKNLCASKSSRPVLVILIHPNADYAGKKVLLSTDFQKRTEDRERKKKQKYLVENFLLFSFFFLKFLFFIFYFYLFKRKKGKQTMGWALAGIRSRMSLRAPGSSRMEERVWMYSFISVSMGSGPKINKYAISSNWQFSARSAFAISV